VPQPDGPPGTDEELLQQHRPVGVIAAAAVLAVLAVVGAVVAIVRVTGTRSHHAARHAPLSPPVAAAEPDASDALVPALSAGSSTSALIDTGSFQYSAALVNDTSSRVTVQYPITVTGPGGVTVPVVFAGIYPAQIGFAATDSGPGTPVITDIDPREVVQVVVRLRVDCRTAASLRTMPPRQPAIHIRLAGHRGSADVGFDAAADGFAGFVREACGHVNG
jgi:hypothetical protein